MLESKLGSTQSLCPICLQVLDAKVVSRDRVVYLDKVCSQHGAMTVRIWPDVDHYHWMESFRLAATAPGSPIVPQLACPQGCGLCSRHVRKPTLAEIEVTQRCNLRCPVCFVAAGNPLVDPSKVDLESMYRSILENVGPQTSIQLTGGEPTVRRDLAEIVQMGRTLGFSAIEINTNGIEIARRPNLLPRLIRAGISGIYLQFDGMTSDVYLSIRGADLLDLKLKAIERCREAGTQVVLAMTVVGGINDSQIGAVLDFALQNSDVVAGIALQPAFTSGRFDAERLQSLSMGDVIFMLADQSRGLIEPYDLWPLGCSHPLCSCATYIIEDQGMRKPFTRLITPQEYIQNFDPLSPQGSVFADIAARQFPAISPGLSVVVMNYMDALSIDLKRLKECSMTVAMENGRHIPFCAYQLTDLYGKRLYPTWGRVESQAVREAGNA
jgi:hypothetical protein